MTRTVSVKLTADVTDLRSKLREGGAAVRQLTGELDKAAKGGHLDKVSDQAALMGAGLLGAAGAAVKMAADFDKAMSGVSVGVQDAQGHMGALRAAAIQAGKDTQYSATQAANGITELGKAGIQSADILGGGLKGALSLAAAGQLDVGEAASIAASAMTQFKLAGNQVPHVADLLAAAAGKAQGSVHDMGAALNQSGLVAGQFGLSVEDTTGVLAEFANAGLIGSDAGTSLRTMLIALANPSKQTQTLMDQLGVSFYDASGKFIGFNGVAQVLQTRLKGLTDQQRQQALGQIFGNDAIRAASILYTDGAKGVDKWRGAVDASGYAAETAQKQTNNLAGDVERLKGSVETLFIESGSGANGGLRVLTKGLNTLVDQFSSMPPLVGSTITVLAGLGGAALLGLAGWVKLRKGIADAVEQLSAMGPTGEKAAGALGKVSSAAGKAAIVFAGLEVLEVVADHFGAASANVNGLTNALTNYVNTGKVAGELSNVFGSDLSDLGKNAQTADAATHGFWGGLNDLTSSIPGVHGAVDALNESIFGLSFNQATDNMASLDQALTSSITSINDYNKASQLWQQVLSKSGLDTQALAKLLPNTYQELQKESAASEQSAGSLNKYSGSAAGATGKLGDLNSALQIGKDAQQKYATEADAVAGAARGEHDAIAALHDLLKSETDPIFKLIDAQKKNADSLKAAKKAQDAMTDAVDKYGPKSKQARAAQAKFHEASLDSAKSALDLQDAVGGLSNTFNGKLDPAFVTALKKAGLTSSQIKDVAKQFNGAKTSADKYANGGPYAPKVSAPGAKQAKAQLLDAKHAADAVAGQYVIATKVTGQGKVEAELRKLSGMQQALKSANTLGQLSGGRGDGPGFDTGGWTGPGDTLQPAGIVHADEFVIKKSSRRKIESAAPGLLDQMNATGYVPGYAGGGGVFPFPVNLKNTKVPNPVYASPAGGGETYKWILAVVAKAFPGLHATSTFRPGAITLSGNRSYHAVGRAVDWPPSKPLAEWINLHYMGPTRELITPWNSLNIKNGRRHTYTGDIYAQHAGTGRFKGNAHDHWAMANGGIIPEHVIGVGRSGRTYEFGEAGPERVTPMRGYAGGGLVNVGPSTSSSSRGSRLDTADAILAARSAVDQLTSSLKENGRTFSMATQKGRDNRSSLISGIKAAQDAAKAKYDETGSVKAANKVYDDYIRQLDASLKKMKVNTATRRALIKAYSERPAYDLSNTALSNSSARVKSVQDFASAEDALANAKTAFAWTKPTFSGRTEQGRAELQTLFSYLSAAEAAAQSQYQETGNAKTATAFYNGYISQLRTILLKAGITKAQVNSLLNQYARITLTRNRWGGLYTHAADGALTDAQIAPAGPTRYAWAEASTGGELFAPKNGNLAKTRAQVGWAVSNWWGGQVTWQPGARTATPPTAKPQEVHLYVHDGKIEGLVRAEVDNSIGSVVSAVIYQSV